MYTHNQNQRNGISRWRKGRQKNRHSFVPTHLLLFERSVGYTRFGVDITRVSFLTCTSNHSSIAEERLLCSTIQPAQNIATLFSVFGPIAPLIHHALHTQNTHTRTSHNVLCSLCCWQHQKQAAKEHPSIRATTPTAALSQRSSGVEGRQTKQKKNVSAAHFLPVFSKRYAIAENGKNGRWKNGGFYGNPDVIIAIYPLHQ